MDYHWGEQNPPMPITFEQSKLLTSALRIKIIKILAEQPRTAKQVADLLGKSPGSIHYHIQRLYDGGILELVETKEAGGILEKYYRSKATSFRPDHVYSPEREAKHTTRMMTNLLLTKEQYDDLRRKIDLLLEEYENIIPPVSIDSEEIREYGIEVIMWEKKEKEDRDE